MADLSTITDAIVKESTAQAEKIIAQAEEECKVIISAAKGTAAKKTEKITTSANEEAESIASIARARAVGMLSTEILKRKTDLIDRIMKKIPSTIYSMDDAEYNELLVKLLNKHAQPRERGEIIFCKRDKSRIFDNTKKVIQDLSLTISDEDGDFGGGFVLRYGRVEENCSVEAIFRENREKITDYLSNRLFA